MVRGRIIVVEGLDDAGKSTLARALCNALWSFQCAHKTLSTAPPPLILREPSPDRPLGKFVRSRLSAPPPAWTPEAWACAMIAAMLEQDFTARSWAEHGGDVIFDRRELSTLVYQGDALWVALGRSVNHENRRIDEYLRDCDSGAKGAALAKFEQACAPWHRMWRLGAFIRDAAASLVPIDLLVWLDCPPEVAATRRAGREAKDQEAFSDLETATRLAEHYKNQYARWVGRKMRVNATCSTAELVGFVLEELAQLEGENA